MRPPQSVLDRFHYPRRRPCTSGPGHQPPAFCPGGFTCSDISYRGNHTVGGLSCLPSLTQHRVFEAHPRHPRALRLYRKIIGGRTVLDLREKCTERRGLPETGPCISTIANISRVHFSELWIQPRSMQFPFSLASHLVTFLCSGHHTAFTCPVPSLGWHGASGFVFEDRGGFEE